LDVALLMLEADPADAPLVSELVAELLAQRASVAFDRLPGVGCDGFSWAGEHPAFDGLGMHFLDASLAVPGSRVLRRRVCRPAGIGPITLKVSQATAAVQIRRSVAIKVGRCDGPGVGASAG
jgi:hypothetical protein